MCIANSVDEIFVGRKKGPGRLGARRVKQVARPQASKKILREAKSACIMYITCYT